MPYVERVLNNLKETYPHEPVFLQAVQEVLQSLQPILDKQTEYAKMKILERIVEPERCVSFRVQWMDDAGRFRLTGGTGFSTTRLWARSRAACAFTPA